MEATHREFRCGHGTVPGPQRQGQLLAQISFGNILDL